MRKTKPLDVPTVAEWLRLPEAEVRAHPTFDAATNTVQVPASLADRAEFARAVAQLRESLEAAFAPILHRVESLVARVTRS